MKKIISIIGLILLTNFSISALEDINYYYAPKNLIIKKSEPVNATCGTIAGTITDIEPTINLCGNGSTSSLVTSTITGYSWTCSNGSLVESCSSLKSALCDNSQFLGCSVPNNALSYTSDLNDLFATWICENGSTVDYCNRAKLSSVNGSCGSANGTMVSSVPSINLCNSGYATSITTQATTHIWSCNGSIASDTQLAGVSSNCSANRQPICASGLTWNGTNCTGTETQPASGSCPSGSYQSGSGCYQDYTSYPYGCSNWSLSYNPATGMCSGSYTETMNANRTCPSGSYEDWESGSCFLDGTRNWVPTIYSCPSGWSQQNTFICTRTTFRTEPAVYYGCSGYISGGICYESSYVGAVNYNCPSGWTRSGSTCSRNITASPIGYY